MAKELLIDCVVKPVAGTVVSMITMIGVGIVVDRIQKWHDGKDEKVLEAEVIAHSRG